MATRANGVGERHGRVARAAALLVAGGVLTALVGGVVLLFGADSGYVPWFSMTTAWEADHDRPAAEHGNGAWLSGDTVVRSRFDSVAGYDVRSGMRRWEFVPPGRADICAIGTAAEAGVGLAVHGELGTADGGGSDRGGRGCTTAAAIDLTTGRELWHTARTGADAVPGNGAVAVGGGLAVVVGAGGGQARPDAVGAFELRTGAPRWQAATPAGCKPHGVAAGARQVLAVLSCERFELRLAAFAPADGALLWSVPLEARRGVSASAEVAFLAADPPVLQVDAAGESGLHAFLSFSPDGRPQGRIDRVGGHGRIPTGRPAQVSVADGRLFAVAEYKGRQGDWTRVVGFDLGTGRELWRADLTGAWSDVVALHAGGGRVTAVAASRKYNDELYVLDARTGDEDDNRSFRDEVADYEDDIDGLLVHGGLVIAVRWGEGVRPVSVYERW